MNKKYVYLGVIPARAGSKRIKNKNLKLINGKPLIYWTIEAAKQSKLLDHFVVSTENSEIKKVAEECGADVIDRPQELATDTATSMDVLVHALKMFPNCDRVVMLQCTSPIRIHGLIDKAIRKYELEDTESLSTGFESFHFEWGTIESMACQQMVGYFYNDGNIEIHTRELILDGKSFGKTRYEYVVPDYYNHEIDTITDFVMIEALMKWLEKEHGALF